MIKAIIFDFGGVLGTDADPDGGMFDEILKITKLTHEEINQIWTSHWPHLKIGKENVSQLWKEIYAKSRTKVKKGKLEQVYKSKIAIYQKALKFAKKLKNNGYRLAILANESKQWMEIKKKLLKKCKLFEKIYSSAEIGYAKPDPKAFKCVLRALKLKPREVLFIDNLEKNINSARELRITSIFYKTLNQTAKEAEKLLSTNHSQ